MTEQDNLQENQQELPEKKEEKQEETLNQAEEIQEEQAQEKAEDAPKSEDAAKVENAAKTEEAPKAEDVPKTEEAPKTEETPKTEEAPKAETEEKTEAKVTESEESVEKVEEIKAEAKVSETKDETASKDEAVEENETKVEIEEKPKAPKVSPEEFLANFDWDALESDEDEKSDSHQKMEATYGDTLSTISENEVVDGKVVALSKREAVVNIGYKSEGIISLNELRYNPDLEIGDTVEVYVESLEDKTGQLLLSHKKARALRSWDRVNQALENDEIIKGFIKCRTKGGMIVDVFGIEAFLPGSQIDVKPIRDYDIYVEKTMEFKVVKINQEYKNVVVSHKALIEAELEQQKKEIISRLEKGQVLEGQVKNITSYGVFIDLGGVDGLIHITDLSWGRVNHPEEIVELDQKLNVVILDFDDDKKRIALGLKQLTKHPWDSLSEDLKVGDKVKGKVVVLADYGAFIEIATGVEGLIHVSEMSWSQHLHSAQEFLKVGDEVEAVILTLDREDRKMSLGIKQLRPDPWQKVEDIYAKGSKHMAKIRNFTGFGAFVEIEEGIDGLIHISDLSWTKKVKHPAEFLTVGEEIEVVVLEIDHENRRLRLGHKQLEENPWDVFETLFNIGSVHEGTVVEVYDKGATVALPYGVEGFTIPRHLVKEDGTSAKVDEKLEFKVIDFSKSGKRIILSHSRIWEDSKKANDIAQKKSSDAETSRGMKRVSDNLEKTTLGDISKLAELKSEMEADARRKLDEMERERTKKSES